MKVVTLADGKKKVKVGNDMGHVYMSIEEYTIKYSGIEDKLRSRHEARFPRTEKENWD